MCSMMDEGFTIPGMWIGKPVASYDTALVDGSPTCSFKPAIALNQPSAL